jgi:tetratricopeptide (TPR) repeat protein
MGSRWAVISVLMHVAGFSGAATAQTPDRRQCGAPDPDVSIRGCTAMIQSGHESRQNLAIAFYNRGNSYRSKGQPDRAIEDYDQAIRLNPNLALAFNNRGLVYGGKRQLDSAIADYNEAIRLDPNFAFAYNNRASRTPPSYNPTAPFRTSTRPSVSTRITPRPSSTGALPTISRANATAPLRITTRPSGSTRITPWPSTSGDKRNEPKAILPKAMQTSPRRGG